MSKTRSAESEDGTYCCLKNRVVLVESKLNWNWNWLSAGVSTHTKMCTTTTEGWFE